MISSHPPDIHYSNSIIDPGCDTIKHPYGYTLFSQMYCGYTLGMLKYKLLTYMLLFVKFRD